VAAQTFYLDSNGNRAWDAGTDVSFTFGAAADVPVTGCHVCRRMIEPEE
jgi:hypothetical protein